MVNFEAAAGLEHLRHERAVERLCRLQHDVRIRDVARKDAFGQDEHVRACRGSLLHQINAGLGIVLPFAADGELSKCDFHAGSPTRSGSVETDCLV